MTSKSFRNVEKLRELISVRDFGAVGDGVADDTAAVHAAMNAAKAKRAAVYFPSGTYRVTSAFVSSVDYQDLYLYGDGQTREGVGAVLGSCVLLDSTSPTSNFFRQTARASLTVENMTFKCAQYVQDREFFLFDTMFHCQFFMNVNFESVEKPIVFSANSYFQNSAYTNVQFRSSGTIHSKPGGSNNLRGTLLCLYNVNHEGVVPINTEKIVCDLTCIRQIVADNFLLEGALPQAGWTVLKLTNPFDAFYTRTTFAVIRNFHSEWGGFAPLYTVDQIGGNVQWFYFVGPSPTTGKYKISSLGSVDISGGAFSGTTDLVDDYFELENAQCVVRLTNNAARQIEPSSLTIKHQGTQLASVDSFAGQVVVHNTASAVPYRWTGGYPLADNATTFVGSGNAMFPSTDATYGRKLILEPDGSGLLNVSITPNVQIKAGMQVNVMALMKLPTFASGLWAALNVQLGSTNPIKYFSSSSSGAIVTAVVNLVALADASSVSISFTNGTTPGATGGTKLEIYALAVYVGQSMPARILPDYLKNITTQHTAAPTTGTWAHGDIVWNSQPAAGGTPGWVCVTAGTPGTWKAMANVAA